MHTKFHTPIPSASTLQFTMTEHFCFTLYFKAGVEHIIQSSNEDSG